MKLKTKKSIYNIVDANHKEGKLHIVFNNEETSEKLQTIFYDKNRLSRLEI